MLLDSNQSNPFFSKYNYKIPFLDECGSESKKTRRILCKNEGTLEIVDDYLCGDQRAKPSEEEACEGKPCKVGKGNMN